MPEGRAREGQPPYRRDSPAALLRAAGRLLLVTGLVGGLAGCRYDPSSVPESPSASSTGPAQFDYSTGRKETGYAGDDVTGLHTVFTVIWVEAGTPYYGFGEERVESENGWMFSMRVRVQNTDSRALQLYPEYFTAVDSEGDEYPARGIEGGRLLPMKELAPDGDRIEGDLVFDVPMDTFLETVEFAPPNGDTLIVTLRSHG